MTKLWTTLFFCYFMQTAMAWRPFIFHFDTVECELKSDIMSFFNCSTVTNKRGARGLSFSIKLNKPMTALRLDMTIFNTRNQKSDFVLMNATDFDGCEFFSSQSSLNIFQILRKDFAKYSNMPKKCPVKKGFELHVKNFVLSPDSFPPYVPETKFTVHVTIRNQVTDAAFMLIHGSVDPKKSGVKLL